MTRVATGTGASADDRRIKIVGTADINDEGLHTNIPDSAGVAISWRFYYVDGSGHWVEYGVGTEFPMYWNNAGTPTALISASSTDFGIWTTYAVHEDPNT